MGMSVGVARMHKEKGERRDFLPAFVKGLLAADVDVFVEEGVGSGMGVPASEYTSLSPRVRIVGADEVLEKDVVLVLRAPEFEEFDRFRRGTILVSMLHFPTRPRRIRKMRALGLDGVSLDSLADDDGRRVVENTRAVGWNGVEAAFDALQTVMPERLERGQPPLHVTVMGTGLVGKHAIEAATKYGSLERFAQWSKGGTPGVEVTAIGRSLTGDAAYMRSLFGRTEILVDATQRSNASLPLVPNEWIDWLPPRAVIADLVVDPYVMTVQPPTVRSIEGIPMGNLDQWIFHPGDKDWRRTIPDGIPTDRQRSVATCYSWPGIHPRDCMALYGRQLLPIMQRLLARGGVEGLGPNGDFLDRVLWRASLRSWSDDARFVDAEFTGVAQARA